VAGTREQKKRNCSGVSLVKSKVKEKTIVMKQAFTAIECARPPAKKDTKEADKETASPEHLAEQKTTEGRRKGKGGPLS